jgi:hypothetical protein
LSIVAVLVVLLVGIAICAGDPKKPAPPKTPPGNSDINIPVEGSTGKAAAPAAQSHSSAEGQKGTKNGTYKGDDTKVDAPAGSIVPMILSLLSLILSIGLASVVVLLVRSQRKLGTELRKFKTESDRLSSRIDRCALVEDVKGLPQLRAETDGLKRAVEKLSTPHTAAQVASAPCRQVVVENGISPDLPEHKMPREIKQEWEQKGILIGKAGWNQFGDVFELESALPTLLIAKSGGKIIAIPNGDQLKTGDYEAYYQRAFAIRGQALGRIVVARPAELSTEAAGYKVIKKGELDVEE